jgi:hypothetical protein
MVKFAMAIGGAVAMLAGTPALAQGAVASEAGSRVTAAITGGTLGVGPEVGFRASDTLGVRANAMFFGVGTDFNSDGVEYDGKLNLESYGAMIDLYPFRGSFRVSAGARINKNRGRVRARPTGPVEVGDETYTPTQIGELLGRAEVKNVAPALTLGWGGSNRRGFLFGFDAGVLFQGKVRIRQFTSSGTLANDPAFRASLEEERQEVQDDVDDYKVYPIVQLSIGYRF